jgi:hypothetical protein
VLFGGTEVVMFCEQQQRKREKERKNHCANLHMMKSVVLVLSFIIVVSYGISPPPHLSSPSSLPF